MNDRELCVYDRSTLKKEDGAYVMKCKKCGLYVVCNRSEDPKKNFEIRPNARFCGGLK